MSIIRYFDFQSLVKQPDIINFAKQHHRASVKQHTGPPNLVAALRVEFSFEKMKHFTSETLTFYNAMICTPLDTPCIPLRPHRQRV